MDALEVSQELIGAARAGEGDRARVFESQLEEVDPFRITGDEARLAFWLNLYNARIIREFTERPKSGNLLRQRSMFSKVGYRVGPDRFSLNDIEHGVLRLNARPPYSLRRTLGRGDRRREAAPGELDPRIHFALNCGAVSCPPIHVYEPSRVDEQLDGATRAYLQTETVVDRESGRVELPYLMKLYKADFGGLRPSDLLSGFAARYLSEPDRTWICSDDFDGRVTYNRRYDWTIAVPGEH